MIDEREDNVEERWPFIRINREKRKQNKQHALDKRNMWKAFETHASNTASTLQSNEYFPSFFIV